MDLVYNGHEETDQVGCYTQVGCNTVSLVGSSLSGRYSSFNVVV